MADLVAKVKIADDTELPEEERRAGEQASSPTASSTAGATPAAKCNNNGSSLCQSSVKKCKHSKRRGLKKPYELDKVLCLDKLSLDSETCTNRRCTCCRPKNRRRYVFSLEGDSEKQLIMRPARMVLEAHTTQPVLRPPRLVVRNMASETTHPESLDSEAKGSGMFSTGRPVNSSVGNFSNSSEKHHDMAGKDHRLATHESTFSDGTKPTPLFSQKEFPISDTVEPSSCSQQAHKVEEDYCDYTMNELASYFDEFVHIPKKMSAMAEMMYG